MKKIPVILPLSISFLLLIAFNACSKNNTRLAIQDGTLSENIFTAIDTLPMEPLSEQEKAGLIRMREEEKLARDVYLALYSKWQLKPFSNISSSEQTHMDAVLKLLEKYGIPDPAAGKKEGEFKDATLQSLYNNLISAGVKSQIEGLSTGALIEDLDIYDLKDLTANTDNQDIKLVYSNLMRGSRNHIRAFTRNLLQMGSSYTPVYLSEEEYKIIIAGDMERGYQGF